jgi:glycerol-3-phosphate dehydrogenase
VFDGLIGALLCGIDMLRDLEGLSHRRFDLLVVGGGIHGLFAAYDAASRGLSVALVERADFGSGLSFNHQRTIHGGLRTLQRGNVRRTRQQIEERRTWARIAPHLIRPLPFLIGTYRWTARSRWTLKAAFAAYDFIGRSRNLGVTPELHLPRARLESAAATRRLFPGVAEEGLTGGAMWYDYQTRHPDRLTWTVALAAKQAGALLVNYVEALDPLKDANGRVTGARAQDVLTGREYAIEAAVTLLAGGSGLGPLMRAFGVTGAPPLLRAMNLLIDRPARDIAVAAPGRSGRMLTAVPWHGYVLVGTDQSEQTVDSPEIKPPADTVDAFLEDLNAAFPKLAAKRTDIRLVHHGLTPAAVESGRVDLLPEPHVIRHASEGVSGVVSMVGVKLTTARSTAATAIAAVAAALDRPPGVCRTAGAPLPHAAIADVEGRLIETQRDLGIALDRDVLEHLSSWYGTEATAVLVQAAHARLLERVTATSPVLCGEILYSASHQDAVRLSDAVLRRTPLGSAGHPGRDALERAAQIMGEALGWSDAQRADEIRHVAEVYAQPIER